MKITSTVEIRATADKVFYWLRDPSRAMEWMASVSRTELIDRTPNWIGTTFLETVEEDGRGTEMRGVVTDFVVNERMAFHLEGAFDTVDVVWTLQEKEQGTVVSQVAEVRFKGLMRVMSVLFGPAFKKKIMAQAQKEFATLKELCERDSQLQ
jgi:carbon monoxide dehydrogenase subunit G